MPVRRRNLERKRSRTYHRIRQHLWAMAFAHPTTHITGTGTRIPASHRLDVMLRRLQPSIRDMVHIRAEQTFLADHDTWTATMEGVMGHAPSAQHFISLNGVPTWKRLTWPCPPQWDDVPWHASLSACKDWPMIVLDLLERPYAATSLVVRIHVVRASSARRPQKTVGGWTGLFEYLCSGVRACSRPPTSRTASCSTFALPSRPRSGPAPFHMLRVHPDPVRTHVLPTSLASVRPIAQVDRKYVLCACQDSDSSIALLCLDQHAVDERVRFEQDASAYATACMNQKEHSRALRPTCVVRAQLPAFVMQVMCFWGWDVTCVRAEWHVKAVPCIVPMHHASIPDLFLQCAAWTADHAIDLSTLARTASPNTHGVASLLRHMPPMLRDVLASHACHTAIRTCIDLYLWYS